MSFLLNKQTYSTITQNLHVLHVEALLDLQRVERLILDEHDQFLGAAPVLVPQVLQRLLAEARREVLLAGGRLLLRRRGAAPGGRR